MWGWLLDVELTHGSFVIGAACLGHASRAAHCSISPFSLVPVESGLDGQSPRSDDISTTVSACRHRSDSVDRHTTPTVPIGRSHLRFRSRPVGSEDFLTAG